MTEPCMFTPPHEPFYCRIHADVRLRLTDERCRRAERQARPVPAGDERERLAALLATIDGEWTKDSHGEGWYSFFAGRLLAAGVHLTGDERLREAAQAVVDERPMDWNATDENRPRIILPEVAFDLLLDRIDRLEAALRAAVTESDR